MIGNMKGRIKLLWIVAVALLIASSKMRLGLHLIALSCVIYDLIHSQLVM